MNAVTKATSVAVLVALGLALTTWAAEPAATPNAETRPDPARTTPPGEVNRETKSATSLGSKTSGDPGTSGGKAVPPTTVVGLWGDRSGIHTNSNPPVRWDYDTGLNIRWHTPTPSFSYSAPVVLKDRVVYLNDVDPEHPWPLLVGLDLATGKECWRVEIIPDTVAQRKEAKDFWEAFVRWRGEFFLRCAEKEPSAEALAKLGLKPGTDLTKPLTKDQMLDPAGPPGAIWTDGRILGQVGLTLDTWRYPRNGSWFFGDTFATPVSDGERVFIQLAWGVWAAYDRDGKQLWMHHLPSQGGGDYCQTGRSPLVWRDRLVADLGDYVRAFDRVTGKELWNFKRSSLKIGQHEMASPMVVTVAGSDYLYCNGYPPFVVRLDDGRPFKITGPIEESPGHIVRTDPDRPDVLFLAGGGEHGGWKGKGSAEVVPPAAIRLVSGEGDTFKAEVLWHGVEGKRYGSQMSWMICHKGRLYFRDIILDAVTGKVLFGKPGGHGTAAQAAPDSTYTLAIAGNRIYGQGYAEHGSEKRSDDAGAAVVCQVFDLDGHYLASNRLRSLAGKAQFRIRNNIPNWCNYANNFTVAGDVILSRSVHEVICIGTPAVPAILPAKALAMLKSEDPATALTGFQAICALGPQAASLAPELAKLAVGVVPGRDSFGEKGQAIPVIIGRPEQLIERARQALAGMGKAAVPALVGMLGDEAGFAAAMQTAVLMDDHAAAAEVLAHGMIEGKAPRLFPSLHPFAKAWGGLTQTESLPRALELRAWAGKDAAAVFFRALPDKFTDKDARARILMLVPLIAQYDVSVLAPRRDELQAWRQSQQLDPKTAAQFDAVLERISMGADRR